MLVNTLSGDPHVVRPSPSEDATRLERLLNPRSVAVVGTGRRTGKIGRSILLNLLQGGFEGPVFPVDPNASYVASVPAFASVRDIPEPVDVVIVAVPANEVLDVAKACIDKGVVGLVVISAGFDEVGDGGILLQAELTALVKTHGIRMIGPNCLGLINTDSNVSLHATFSPQQPLAGNVGLLSQSGAVGIEAIEIANKAGLGLSLFVSAGNKADVSGNDLLGYWENDANTSVVMLYLESFGNPRRFSQIARRVARQKPIIAVKSGRTGAAVRAAVSHTGAMASADIAVDALLHQAGVIRADTVEDMVDVALVLDRQPLPGGSRVVIVGNSGGPGIMAADACRAAGLSLADLSGVTNQRLRTVLKRGVTPKDPLDLLADASAADYEAALGTVLADEGVDAAIVIFTRTLPGGTRVILRALEEVASQYPDKTIVTCFLGVDGQIDSHRLPWFSSVERAVRALGRTVRYSAWRRESTGNYPELEVDGSAARSIVERNAGWLTTDAATALLGAYGIPVVTTVVAQDTAQAVAAAESMGVPVVIKSAQPGLVHKSDVGGVRLDLRTQTEIAEAVASVKAALGDVSSPVLVQPMVQEGVEVIIGVVHDNRFGPLVMFGLGGVATELLGDRAFRLVPMSDTDAAALVRTIRGCPLLFGYRNTSKVDVESLEGLLLRVARLAEDIPELLEMDLNPVMVTAAGVVVVDAKVRLSETRPYE